MEFLKQYNIYGIFQVIFSIKNSIDQGSWYTCIVLVHIHFVHN